MLHTSHGQVFQEFTVPGTGGNYATQIVYLRSDDPTEAPDSLGGFDYVSELQVHLGSLVTGVTIEVDILKQGGDPAVAGDWLLAVESYTTAGLHVVLALAGVPGVRIRAKSGGTGGTQSVQVWWW